jgi:uncharacterized membrane protein YgcG
MPLADSHLATNWWTWILPDGDAVADACTPPTIEQFRSKFPELISASDDLVTSAIAEACCSADMSWSSTCNDCQLAILYMAAHIVAMSLLSASWFETMFGGQPRSISFESMRVMFSGFGGSGGGGGMRSGGGGSSGGGGVFGAKFGLQSTPYGTRYIELLTLNKPAILVI